jgi:hypothetical protein
MRKLWLALALLGLAVAPASAQQTSTPMIGAIAGAYNGVTAPNITAGKFGLVQIDSHGNLVVSCTNCGAASISGPFNVTVTNNATGPVIVSSPSGFGGAGSSSLVTVTNTAAVPVFISSADMYSALIASIPAGTNAIGVVTISNILGTTTVTCTNCGSASISNVTVVNGASSPVLVSVLNTNAITTGTNTIGGVNVRPATAGGWTTKLLNGLTTTKTTIKNAAGQLAKIYCYNPNSSVAYVQIFDALTGSITLGTTSPVNSLGIPATSAAGYALADIGDQFATAISVAATTTVVGLTAPSTALDCNASYN